MNKKFLSAILFGALMVTSTGTFVSCKDYDDDIDSINKELTDIKSQIAALQSKVDGGKYVTNVAKNGEGITVTWSDGTNSTIETIKGDKGDQGEKGAAVAVTIDPTTKNWLIDGVDTGVCAEGKNGDAAATPVFSVGADGHIYVQYGADAEKEDLGVSTGGIYIVENGPKVTLHVPDAEGVYADIVLPKTAAITEIKAVTIVSNPTYGTNVRDEEGNYQYGYYRPTNMLSDGAYVTLYYGQAKAAGKYFDGTAFAKGEILTSAQSANKIQAQVNPTMADASVYDFYLTDSKGNSYLKLTKATPNKTEGALSRAEATVNKGIYDMGIEFAEGITLNQIKTLYKEWDVTSDWDGEDKIGTATTHTALAIATKDAYGNEVLSEYDVRVGVSTGESRIEQEKIAEIEVNKTLDLNSVLYMHNIIDVKYTISTDQTAKKDQMGVVLEGSKISAQKVGTIKVTVDYMNCEGVKTTDEGVSGEFDITVNFVSTKNTGALNVEWTVGEKTNNAYVKTLNVNDYTVNAGVDGNNNFGYDAAITYINADGVKVNAPADAIVPSFASTDADANGVTDGYWTRTLKYTFDPAKVIPTTYTHVIPYGDNDKLTVTIVVKEPTSYFNFQVLDAYFNADKTEATAYGTPNGTTIDYNLFRLFNKATVDAAANITFSEVVPERIKNADGNWAYAAPWLNGTDVADNDVEWISDDAIVVDKVNAATDDFFGGAYAPRAITAKYQPYGNANLTPAKMTFNLTIKSEIFEGTLEYVKATKNDKGVQTGWTAGDIKEVDGGKDAKLSLDELLGKDVYGKAYNDAWKLTDDMLDEARIAKVAVVLADDNAKEYLKLSSDNFANGAITISKKSANTAIVTPPTCTVQVQVTDKWNKVKTVDVQVKVVK